MVDTCPWNGHPCPGCSSWTPHSPATDCSIHVGSGPLEQDWVGWAEDDPTTRPKGSFGERGKGLVLGLMQLFLGISYLLLGIYILYLFIVCVFILWI